jgi:hypothetical protein
LFQKSRIFGPPEQKFVRRVNAIVSLAIAFLVVAYSPIRAQLLLMFTKLFTGGAIVIIGLTLFVLFTFIVNLVAKKMILSAIVGAILTFCIFYAYIPPLPAIIPEIVFVIVILSLLVFIGWLFTA